MEPTAFRIPASRSVEVFTGYQCAGSQGWQYHPDISEQESSSVGRYQQSGNLGSPLPDTSGEGYEEVTACRIPASRQIGAATTCYQAGEKPGKTLQDNHWAGDRRRPLPDSTEQQMCCGGCCPTPASRRIKAPVAGCQQYWEAVESHCQTPASS